MRALVYEAPWRMTLQDLPAPTPAAGEVLLRISTVGICGSDVHGFTGESGRRTPGMVMGHEAAGVVVAHGAGVSSPPIGSLAAVYNILGDGPPTPEEGDPSFLNKRVLGVNLGRRGAMAEFLAVPADCAIPLPAGTPAELAPLAEPVAVVGHGLARLEGLGIQPRRVAVIGAGTIGLTAAILLRRQAGTEVALLDTVAAKAARGASYGALPITVVPGASPVASVAESLGGAPDVVIDAVGTGPSFELALALVANKGAVLLVGNLAKEVTLPLQAVVGEEVSLVGTYGFAREDFARSVTLLPELKGPLQTFIEGHCSLEEAPEVMTQLARGERQALKIVIDVGPAD